MPFHQRIAQDGAAVSHRRTPWDGAAVSHRRIAQDRPALSYWRMQRYGLAPFYSMIARDGPALSYRMVARPSCHHVVGCGTGMRCPVRGQRGTGPRSPLCWRVAVARQVGCCPCPSS